MNKVLYAKFSRERSVPFQIATLISEENGKKAVTKQALAREAAPHVGKLPESYEKLQKLYTYPNLRICPCYAETEDRVSFPFITGKSMETVLTEHIQAGEFEKVKGDVQLLWDILASSELEQFQVSGEFAEVFGTVKVPAGQRAAKFSNLDMIFANILVEDQADVQTIRAASGQRSVQEEENSPLYYLVDYEWVFDFMVPISFIFARSLLLHGAFQTLSREQQEELYAIGGVRPEDVPVYYGMEVSFQKYVVGKDELYVLSKLYPRMKTCSFFLDYWNTAHVYYAVQVLGVPKDHPDREEELHFSLHFQGEVKERIQITNPERYQELILKPADTECILKLYYIEGEGPGKKEAAAVTGCNAQVHYEDIYHFRENPMFRIKNNGYQTLSIGYIVYHRNDYLVKEGIELRLQNAHLQKRLNTFIWPYKAVRKVGRIVKNKLKK